MISKDQVTGGRAPSSKGENKMVAAMKKDYSMEEYEAKYHDITALYVLAEDLVATVQNVSNPQAQIDLVEPLINELAEATDILTEEFLLIAESKKTRASNKASKAHIEGALRKIFSAINLYQMQSKQLMQKTKSSVANIADAIVTKIQHQLDKVVTIFLEFIQVSLQSIMNKSELDALRVRDANIALMMHQLSLAQHGG